MNVLEQLERAAAQEELHDERYIIVKELGRGGMGKVWLAEKRLIGEQNKPVVLKTPTLPDHPDERQRRTDMFLREMETAALLEHDNIVRVTGWGTDLFGSTPYFEMERIRGISLLALLAERGIAISEEEKWGALPPQDVAFIGMQAAEGLHFAHNFRRTGENDAGGGVVHRDISPDNLMVDVHGVVKITDWGIAKALNAAGQATRTGTVIGKPRYMAPEQLRGLRLDARADVYSLAITLTVALSGRHVFARTEHDTWDSVALRVVQGDRPAVAELAPDAPPDLHALLEEMMRVDRDQRPATAGELVERFARVVEQLGGYYTVKKGFAARVKERYKEGLATTPMMPAVPRAKGKTPTHSTRRPISAATRQDRPQRAQPAPVSEPSSPAATTAGPAPASTQPMGLAAATAPSPSSTTGAAPHSSRRPLLIGALAASVLVLLALVAGLVGFMVGGDSAEVVPTPRAGDEGGQPADVVTPEPPSPAEPEELALEDEEPFLVPSESDPDDIDSWGQEDEEPFLVPALEPAEAAPPVPSPRPRPLRDRPAARPQRDEPRPLAPAPTPTPSPQQQRATDRTPSMSDLGF